MGQIFGGLAFGLCPELNSWALINEGRVAFNRGRALTVFQISRMKGALIRGNTVPEGDASMNLI